jgi:hypothetical protein
VLLLKREGALVSERRMAALGIIDVFDEALQRGGDIAESLDFDYGETRPVSKAVLRTRDATRSSRRTNLPDIIEQAYKFRRASGINIPHRIAIITPRCRVSCK